MEFPRASNASGGLLVLILSFCFIEGLDHATVLRHVHDIVRNFVAIYADSLLFIRLLMRTNQTMRNSVLRRQKSLRSELLQGGEMTPVLSTLPQEKTHETTNFRLYKVIARFFLCFRFSPTPVSISQSQHSCC